MRAQNRNKRMTRTKDKERKELPNGIHPPDQLRLCASLENSGPSTRQTPEAGPSTHRSTDYAPPLWCGHPKSHLYLSGVRHSEWLQPKPGFQFTILLWSGLGAKWRKILFFFPPVVTGGTWTCNLSIDSQVLYPLGHIVTHTHTHAHTHTHTHKYAHTSFCFAPSPLLLLSTGLPHLHVMKHIQWH